MPDIPDTPHWLNWLAALCGIFGVTIFGLVGLVIGNIPSVRVRPKPSQQRQQGSARPSRQRGRGRPVSVTEEVRSYLFHWVVQTHISVANQALIAIIGVILLAAVIVWYVYMVAPQAGPTEMPIMPLLRKVDLAAIAVFALVEVFVVARLRWRIRYENVLRSEGLEGEHEI